MTETIYTLSSPDGRYVRVVVARHATGWRASVSLRLRGDGDDGPAERVLGQATGDERDGVSLRALGLARDLLDMDHVWRAPS